MCDFRKIKKIRLLSSEEIIDVEGLVQDIRSERWEKPCDLKKGLYYIIASGSFHQYYDGENWHWENKGWEVIDYETQEHNCI